MKVHVIKVDGKTMDLEDLEDLIGNSREHTPVDFESLVKGDGRPPKRRGRHHRGRHGNRDLLFLHLRVVLDDLREIRKDIETRYLATAIGHTDRTINSLERIIAERS